MTTKVHDVAVIKLDETFLYLAVDGQSYRFRWLDCSPMLAAATQTQREYLEISPSGYGLHWPLIDEDLAITPLLEQAGEIVDLAVNPS